MAQLNENCTVSVFNRTAQVRPDGTWIVQNAPANFGRVRARATCVEGGVEVLLHSGGRQVVVPASVTTSQLNQIDYDNDGWLDVLAGMVPRGTAVVEFYLRLHRNAGASGWQDVTVSCGLSTVPVDMRSKVLAADFDGDGDSDLLFAAPGGRLVLLDNEGGNANRQLKIQLTGTKSNRSGIEHPTIRLR